MDSFEPRKIMVQADFYGYTFYHPDHKEDDAMQPIAAADAFGEVHKLLQVIAYDASTEEGFVSIRYDEHFNISEIYIPEKFKDRIVSDEDQPSKWMKHRDGK